MFMFYWHLMIIVFISLKNKQNKNNIRIQAVCPHVDQQGSSLQSTAKM